MVDQSQLRTLFSRWGFRDRSVEHPDLIAASEAIFESKYALVAVISAPSVAHILEGWSEWQVTLADIEALKVDGISKDKYLVFITDAVPDEAQGDLQRILNNTTVSRKICVQLNGRPFEEALMETPFCVRLPIAESVADDSPSSSRAFEESRLSREVLDDLSRRSEEVIVNKLLNDEYDSGVLPDEDSGTETG